MGGSILGLDVTADGLGRARNAGYAALECYGIVGMASPSLRDGVAQLSGVVSSPRLIEKPVDPAKLDRDIHKLMGEPLKLKVIDIDRKPFGFGESRKQAPLRNIQNVRAERPGFFATLFDYGNVHIETAGADSDIIFDRIPHPSQVLSDIFRRLEEYRENQRRKDGETRREEYAVLLDVYRQEMERDRIPRRMPPIDE